MEETHDAPYRSTLNLKSAAPSRCRRVAVALLSRRRCIVVASPLHCRRVAVTMYLCRCIDVLLHDRIVMLLCRRAVVLSCCRAVVLLCRLVLQARDQLEIRSAITLLSRCRRNVFVLLHCCVAT